ncbi:MAG: MBL fold metallo-hydrolase [Sedimentisphaerales bacterium]|nr:MBL fold metallo-hydrolase [Sedimentisphaerales bacterium]
MVNQLTITILVDNTPNRDAPGLVCEHGWSAWIEADGHRVLLDAGASDLVLRNAAALGVPLSEAETIVLSHGHYDHTGGLATVLAAAPGAAVYLHPAALGEHFSNHPGKGPRAIGLPQPSAAALAGRRVVRTEGPTEIAPGVHVTGAVPRRTDFEDVGGPFFLDAAAAQPDPIEDDQAVWIDTPRGAVVVLGCAHAGIVNTLDHVTNLTGGGRIHAVLGGTHLVSASAQRLQRTADALRRFGVKLLAPCHCTGAAAMDFLQDEFPRTFLQCTVGTRLTFGGLRHS